MGAEATTAAPRHTLVVIGEIGSKRCYLDMTREDAILRHVRDTGETVGEDANVEELTIGDSFTVYDIWG